MDRISIPESIAPVNRIEPRQESRDPLEKRQRRQPPEPFLNSEDEASDPEPNDHDLNEHA